VRQELGDDQPHADLVSLRREDDRRFAASSGACFPTCIPTKLRRKYGDKPSAEAGLTLLRSAFPVIRNGEN
jgi:hypothetical protein